MFVCVFCFLCAHSADSERERQDAAIYRARRDAAPAGHSAPSAAPDSGASSAALFVSFTCARAGLNAAHRVRVSCDMTVPMVRDLAFRATGVPPYRQRLFAHRRGDVQGAALDQDHSLEWYGLLHGVCVHAALCCVLFVSLIARVAGEVDVTVDEAP